MGRCSPLGRREMNWQGKQSFATVQYVVNWLARHASKDTASQIGIHFQNQNIWIEIRTIALNFQV